MGSRSRFLCLGLVILLPFADVGKTRKTIAEPAPPAGWVRLPTPMEGSFALECGNYAGHSWQVSLKEGSLEISPLANRSDRSSEPGLLPQLKVERGMAGRESMWKLPDGWLLGFDGGEAGGGLWRTNDDGSVSRKLLSENVYRFLPFSQGVSVLAGVVRGVRDSGKVYTFSSNEIHPLVDLDGAPVASMRESEGSILVATPHGVSRVSAAGMVEVLSAEPFSRLYPNSVAITADGTVYVGMRMFVVRLLHTPKGYMQEWLVPDDCRRFAIQHFDCVCQASGK